MTCVRLAAAAALTMISLVVPHSASAVGPQITPKVLLTEAFESPPSTFATTPWDNGADHGGTTAGFWAGWTWRQHSGVGSLWCGGSNPAAVTATTYAEKSAGYASFPLTMTVDYYSSTASFYYTMPSLGQADDYSFVPQWAPSPNPGYYGTLATPARTASGAWASAVATLTPTSGQTSTSLSRKAGEFRFQWADAQEGPDPDPEYGSPLVHVGEGPSVDDLTVAGWKYGPVRSLGATSTSVSATLTWSRPARSNLVSTDEERVISYRVWRAPAGTSTWTELTSSEARLANGITSFKDTSVADATAYSYAVQAWDPGTGVESGEYRQINVTTAPLPLPLVAISSPASGSVDVGTDAITVTGTATGLDGASISSAWIVVKRDDDTYFNGVTGQWGAAPASVAASVAGTSAASWSANWTPPGGDFHAHVYTITAATTDSRGKSATSAITMRVDSVPYLPPTVAVTSPAQDAVVVGTGAFSLTGVANVESGLPAAQVTVKLSRDGSTWWNGTSWTPVESSVPATVIGASWSVNALPPTSEYLNSGFTVTATATDAHGLVATSLARSFRIDSVAFVAPSATMITPVDGADMLGVGPYTLRGSAAAQPALPLAAVRLTIARDDGTWWNGSAWVASPSSVLASGTASWTYSWQPPAGEYLSHHYAITASASDAHGLTGSSGTANVRVNTIVPNPPDVAVSYPADGSEVVDADAVAVSGTAAGRDGAVVTGVKVRIQRDDGSWWSGSAWQATPAMLTATGTGSWTYQWQPPSNEYFAHSYRFWAFAADTHGQEGTSTPVSARLDSVPFTAPTTSVTSPAAGTTLVGTSLFSVDGVAAATPGLQLTGIRVTIHATNGITHVNSWWTGSGWSSSETSIAASGLSAWSCTFLPQPADNLGYTYAITSFATDQHGLRTTSSPIIVNADTTGSDKPVVSIASTWPGGVIGKRSSFVVTGTSTSAAGTSVVSVDVVVRRDDGKYLDGSGFSADTPRLNRATGTNSWGFTVPVTDTGRHRYTITAEATDNRQGNRVGIGVSPAVSLVVDNSGTRLVGVRSLSSRLVELRFNERVRTGSVALADFKSSLRLVGLVRVSADGKRVRIATSRQNAGWTYRVSVRPGAISDVYGNTSGASNPVLLRMP